MPKFDNLGVTLSFMDEGDPAADPILLIHGFASSMAVNWVGPGWVKTLTGAGYRVIALDNRGHGDSEKLHDPDAYTPEIMAGDSLALLRYLEIGQAHVMGYSMGARISAFLALAAPGTVRSLIFGGLGIGMVEGLGSWEGIEAALLADSANDAADARSRAFRVFADQTGSDRIALAACIRTSRKKLTPEQMGSIAAPTLVSVGTKDDIAGSPHELARLMPDARALDIEGRDHMLAVGDRMFKAGALEFLDALQ
ncbi:alpha/beta fold hydrolase [Oricola sp.]|uniref:alpha/beta fold hydrolase n=1 Tax=Oricola sp. TaxID=1979950 RepID=UPI003BABFCF7